MGGVEIDFGTLNQIAGTLKRISGELAGESARAEDVAQSLDEPFPGERRLADLAREAAVTWEYSRGVLAENVYRAALRCDVVGQAWSEWDDAAGGTASTELAPGSFGSDC